MFSCLSTRKVRLFRFQLSLKVVESMPFVDQIINWLKNQDGNITDLEEVGSIYLLFLSHSNDTFKTFKRWFFFGFFAYRFNRLLFTVHFFLPFYNINA